jgi:hypothetical protein
MTTLYAIGDSLTVGAFLPDYVHQRYCNLFADHEGWDEVNLAQGSRRVADFLQNQAFTLEVEAANMFCTQLATNDMGSNFVQAPFGKSVQALLAYMAIPEANKVRAQSPSVAYAGTWANSAYYGGSWGKYSTQAGAIATFTVSGTVIYISHLAVYGAGNSMTVTVDGNNLGTLPCYGSIGGWDVTYTQFLYRISGLANVAHTVVLTVVSDTSRAEFEWAAGIPPHLHDRAEVWVGNQHYVNGVDYTRAAANIETLAAVNLLRSDGLHVYHIDVYSIIQPADMYDTSHWNAQGHAKVATAYEAVVRDSLSSNVDIEIELASLLASFKSLENAGTWGIDIDLGVVGNYQPPDGDGVNFDLEPYTPVAWNMANFVFGSGMDLPPIGIRADYTMLLGDAVAIEMSMVDLADILIMPYFYSPPDGDSVNFILEEYTPVAWNMVNWVWPSHCLVELDTYDISIGMADIELLIESNPTLRVFLSSKWVRKAMVVYGGEAWVTAPLKAYWDAEWKDVVYPT